VGNVPFERTHPRFEVVYVRRLRQIRLDVTLMLTPEPLVQTFEQSRRRAGACENPVGTVVPALEWFGFAWRKRQRLRHYVEDAEPRGLLSNS
jgi:hypothetical protein